MLKKIQDINLVEQRKFIAEISSHYVNDRRKQIGNIRKELEDICNYCDDGPVLEIGVGGGTVLEVLKSFTENVVGIEIVKEMLDQAAHYVPGRLVCADAAEIPFTDETFPLVVCWGNTLGPIPGNHNRQALLDESFRVLKDGGYLALSVINRYPSIRSWFRPHEYSFHYHSKTSEWISKNPGYNRNYSIHELRKKLKLAGYSRIIRLTGIRQARLAVLAQKA